LININKELKIKTPLEHPDAKRLQTCVNAVIEAKTFGTLIVSSEGLGKTRGIRNIIEQYGLIEGKDWIHIAANITDTELFKTLFQHRYKLIFFDDIGKAAKTHAGITVLKQATETKDGKHRIVCWNSPTYVLNDFPKEFIFYGRIIMCLNSRPDTRDADIRAFLSRLLSCEFFPSNKTILEMIWSLIPIKKKIHNMKIKHLKEIFNHIKTHTTTDNYKISLRLYDKAIMWFNTDYTNWKEYVLEDMGLDHEVITVINIIESKNLRGKAAIDDWTVITGKKKTRFYEVYKVLKQQCIIQ